MATMPNGSVALPTAGAEMKSAQLTSWMQAVYTFVNANTIDEANVDYTSADGIMVMGRAQTITGAKTHSAAITVGVNDTGHDVKFFGATAGAHLLWDESADTLKLVGAAKINAQGTVTVGVDDTGYDVQMFGATSGSHLLWDESADDLKLVGAAGLTVAGTAALNVTTTTTLASIGTVTVGVDDTGHDVKMFGATSGKSWLWDESADKMIVTGTSTFTGNTQQTGTLTVGVDDTGYDVKLFGATTGKSWLWDESANKMIVTGDAAVTGGTTLTGVTQQTGAFTVGVNDTGHDVKFFGATASKFWEWDESANQMNVAGSVDVNGATQMDGTLTVGLNDTGYDVQLFGATAGSHLLWDESADSLLMVGGAKINAQGTVTVGVDDTGYDVKMFGATAGKSWLWDESADTEILTGNSTVSGTLGVTGVGTFTAQSVHTGGLVSGSNIVSDADSTDDLGTTSARWANLYVDSIGDTGQALAFTSGTNNTTMTAAILALTGAQTVSSTLGVTGLVTATAGISSGSNIVSDADSTDDLGTTGVRWANLYVDAIVATDTIAATSYTGALLTAVTAVTQSSGNNSTKVATTAYADAAGGSASGTGFGFFLIGS